MTAPATAARLPVVDAAALRSGDAGARAGAAAVIHAACMDAGFFYVSRHGVSDDLQRATFDATRTFFALPPERKLALDVAGSPAFRGYAPMGRQTLEPGTPPDRKESFALGTELPDDHLLQHAGLFGYGPNRWPKGLTGFRETLTAYREAMLELAETLMVGMALSLRLSADAFAGFCVPPVIAGLRLLHYPPHPADATADETGCGAHTDWGGITVLLQDDAGGLQMWEPDRGWTAIPPCPGTFVINIGDMMARWTNDAYRSTRHRVINRSGRSRFSVAFFYDGRADHVVRCVPECLAPGATPTYPPTTPAEHLAEMKRRSYAS